MTSRHSLSHRLLSLTVAFAWALGPCKASGAAVLMAAVLDGQHDVAMGESQDGFDLVLRHHGGADRPFQAPLGHHHTAWIAWLTPGSDGNTAPHPDHVISFHSGSVEAAACQKSVMAEEDSAVAEQPRLPVITVIEAPESRAAIVWKASEILPFQAQAPPGTAALLI